MIDKVEACADAIVDANVALSSELKVRDGFWPKDCDVARPQEWLRNMWGVPVETTLFYLWSRVAKVVARMAIRVMHDYVRGSARARRSMDLTEAIRGALALYADQTPGIFDFVDVTNLPEGLLETVIEVDAQESEPSMATTSNAALLLQAQMPGLGRQPM